MLICFSSFLSITLERPHENNVNILALLLNYSLTDTYQCILCGLTTQRLSPFTTLRSKVCVWVCVSAQSAIPLSAPTLIFINPPSPRCSGETKHCWIGDTDISVGGEEHRDRKCAFLYCTSQSEFCCNKWSGEKIWGSLPRKTFKACSRQ